MAQPMNPLKMMTKSIPTNRMDGAMVSLKGSGVFFSRHCINLRLNVQLIHSAWLALGDYPKST